MTGSLGWALSRARTQTLALVADIPADMACRQVVDGEHHPTWIIGHLVLADAYLLYLLDVAGLGDDFSELLQRYGPGATPVPDPSAYDPLASLISRLRTSGEVRLATVARMTAADLARSMPDQVLAPVQPTIGHHLETLVYHEGYHGGQLTAWRRSHRLLPASWAFGPGNA